MDYLILIFFDMKEYFRFASNFCCSFLARDSIYAIVRYMPSPVRPSVCHTGGSVKDG